MDPPRGLSKEFLPQLMWKGLYQSPGRIQKVEPSILDSNAPMVGLLEAPRWIYFLDPPRGLGCGKGFTDRLDKPDGRTLPNLRR